jgi:glucose/arabinose dehydrogenase
VHTCLQVVPRAPDAVGITVWLQVKKRRGHDHAKGLAWVPQRGRLWLEVRKNGGPPRKVRTRVAPSYTDTVGWPLITTGPVWEYDGPGVRIRACASAADGSLLTCTRSH